MPEKGRAGTGLGIKKKGCAEEMREKLARFMVGRYGQDEFGQFLFAAALVTMLLSVLFGGGIWYTMALLLLIFAYYRMLSKNHARRYQENSKYLLYSNKAKAWLKRKQYQLKQYRQFHIYRCPSCKQKIRVPRGKGKISISCPKCRTEFVKKS